MRAPRFRRLLTIVYFTASSLLVAGCGTPRSFTAVDAPRAGRPVGRVCVVYSNAYQIDFGGLEKLHPFDINKYSRIYLGLVTDGVIASDDVYVPGIASAADIGRVHTSAYLESLTDPGALAAYLEFELLAWAPAEFSDRAVLQPFRHATGGTILAGHLAIDHGMAVNLGGGYHHAGPYEGGGFCIYADMPIAIRRLQAEGLIERALVIDLDVHQGNGTALSFKNDDTVYTFDMFQEDIYPVPKEYNDLDVPLPAGTTDDTFLGALAEYLPAVFEHSNPDIVFLQAGVDSLEGDPLADFALSADGIIRRDAMVFAESHRRGIPIVMVLGGGYSDRAWTVQRASIRALLDTYGVHRAIAARRPTVKEKLYTQ